MDFTNVAGETVLLAIASVGLADGVRALLDAKASVNVVDDKKWMPLMKAVENGRTRAAKVLLEANANVMMKNKDSSTSWKPRHTWIQ